MAFFLVDLIALVKGDNLAKILELPDPSGNQLGKLRSKIQYDYFF
jgi:hypothetical protein